MFTVYGNCHDDRSEMSALHGNYKTITFPIENHSPKTVEHSYNSVFQDNAKYFKKLITKADSFVKELFTVRLKISKRNYCETL
jgi:ABC-type uncharacterized transport system substrate-binding protein